MGKTAISWTDKVWNPTTGCSKVSPGCAKCYAEAVTKRYGPSWGVDFKPWIPANAEANVVIHPDRLDTPLTWRKPCRVFVNSMSDLFHEQVNVHFIAEVFARMAACPHITFQVLTKRPERMRELMNGDDFADLVDVKLLERGRRGAWCIELDEWPLPNVHLGTSVENQRWADERIPLLLQTPAAVRFLSVEPMLGPIDLSKWLDNISNLPPMEGDWCPPPRTPTGWYRINDFESGLHWAICGAESGPGRRAFNEDWARDLRDQCEAAGVAFFMKQNSAFRPGDFDSLPDDLKIQQFPVSLDRTVVHHA